MSLLEISPQTNGHQTNSADLQVAFSQIGDNQNYDSLHIKAGIYLINDPNSRNTFSVLALNNGSNIYGDVDAKGNPSTIFMLMDNAPTNPFSCGMPIIGPAKQIGQNIEFSKIGFDGNSEIGCSNQANFSNAKCSGTQGGVGVPYGKGFSNFIGALKAAYKDCSFHDISVLNSAGDGFRSTQWYPSKNLEFYNWKISNCGHCGIMLENTTNVDIHDITVITRSNGGIRTQNKCSDISIKNVHVIGTENDYNPGMQITGDNISISNCLIHDTLGPGIEIQGDNNTGIVISNNQFITCGTFEASAQISGVGGILINGASAIVENNLFYGCLGNSIAANVYRPDGAIFSKSGYKIDTKNNMIINTLPANYPCNGSGKAIANFLTDTHTVTSIGNKFHPLKNYSLDVVFND